MATIRFEDQELGIGMITPKMVESHLEGEKVVDLDVTTLGRSSVCLLVSSSFNLSFFTFLSRFSLLLLLNLIFVTCARGCWMEGKTSHSLTRKDQNDPRS